MQSDKEYLQIKEKERLILVELSATLNVVNGLEQVLDDILLRTSDHIGTDSSLRNVRIKQEELLRELGKWKEVLGTLFGK
jgi:hypothetical protein